MEAVSSRKCHFYNIGYCKHKDKGCKHVHPEEKCALPRCTDIGCPKRHQKYCIHKGSCKFLYNQSCEFLHKKNNHVQGDNTNNIVASDKGLITKLNTLEDIIIDNKKQIKEKNNEILQGGATLQIS